MTLVHIILWFTLLYAYITLKGGLSNIARNRLYKSGMGWCVWRWTDVESEYILRLHVFKSPWFAVCLHWIRKADKEPWLHDHPVSFLSLVLRGGYAELRAAGGDVEHRVHRWFNFIRASSTDRHRIIFTRTNTLTLCFMGPKTREWGFHMGQCWVHWKDYYARLKSGENVRKTWDPEPWIPALERELGPTLDRMTRDAELKGLVFDDEKPLDTAPADDFDSEEATWPTDHK